MSPNTLVAEIIHHARRNRTHPDMKPYWTEQTQNSENHVLMPLSACHDECFKCMSENKHDDATETRASELLGGFTCNRDKRLHADKGMAQEAGLQQQEKLQE